MAQPVVSMRPALLFTLPLELRKATVPLPFTSRGDLRMTATRKEKMIDALCIFVFEIMVFVFVLLAAITWSNAVAIPPPSPDPLAFYMKPEEEAQAEGQRNPPLLL